MNRYFKSILKLLGSPIYQLQKQILCRLLQQALQSCHHTLIFSFSSFFGHLKIMHTACLSKNQAFSCNCCCFKLSLIFKSTVYTIVELKTRIEIKFLLHESWLGNRKRCRPTFNGMHMISQSITFKRILLQTVSSKARIL